MSELPVLDPRPLRDLLEIGAEQELIRELIDLYQEDVPGRMTALRSALATANIPQILMESHQLKGALGNLGLLRFAELAARLEAEAREGRLETAPVIVEALPSAYQEGLGALNEAFPLA